MSETTKLKSNMLVSVALEQSLPRACPSILSPTSQIVQCSVVSCGGRAQYFLQLHAHSRSRCPPEVARY